jgi:hypothetical protein
MIDPIVHAALVIVFAWLVRMVFLTIGVDLGEDVYMSLAGVIVAYILSLFGLDLFQRVTAKSRGLTAENQPGYKPPFT